MKYEIEIEGLPEGWKPVKLKAGNYGNIAQEIHYVESVLLLEKIQPRRIVLEETQERNIQYASGIYQSQSIGGKIVLHNKPKIWRVVKEIKDKK